MNAIPSRLMLRGVLLLLISTFSTHLDGFRLLNLQPALFLQRIAPEYIGHNQYTQLQYVCPSIPIDRVAATSTVLYATISSNSAGITTLPRNSVEFRLRGCIMRSDWETAATILSSLNSTRVPTGRDVLYIVCETCRRVQKLKSIPYLLEQLPNDIKCFSSENDVMPLLSECANSNNMWQVQPAITFLRSKGVAFSAKAYSTMIKGHGRQGNERMIDRLLEELQQDAVVLDIVFVNAVMDAYIRCGNLDKAYSIFVALTTAVDCSDASTSPSSPTTTLASTMESEEAETTASIATATEEEEASNDRSPSVLRMFRSSGLTPNAITFNTLIKGFRAQDGNSVQQCFDLLQQMEAMGVAPNSITVNTLIDVSVLHKNFQQAEELLISNDLAAPGVEAYTSLIHGYALKGDVQAAFRILEAMKQRGVAPNSRTLTALMSAACNARKFSLARNLLLDDDTSSSSDSSSSNSRSNSDRRIDGGSSSDGIISSSSSSSSGSGNRKGRYFTQLTRSERAALHGAYVIKLCKFNEFIGSLIRDGEMSEAVGYPKQHQYLQEALSTLLLMEEKSLLPDAATLNAFIRCICSSEYVKPLIRESLQLFQTMLSMKITPDDYTYAVLFNALGEQGLLQQALQLYQSLQVDGITLQTAAINNLLKAFVGGSEPLYSIGLFFELLSRGNSISSAAAATAASAVEQEKEAEEAAPTAATFIPDKISFTMMFIAVAKSISTAEDTALRSSSAAAVRLSSSSSNVRGVEAAASIDLPQRVYIEPAQNAAPTTATTAAATRSPLYQVYKSLGILEFRECTTISSDDDNSAAATEAAERKAGGRKNESLKPSRNEEEKFLSAATSLRYDEVAGRLYEVAGAALNQDATVSTSAATAKKSTATAASTSAAATASNDYKAAYSALSTASKGQMTKRPEVLLRELYQLMRFRYRIEPDDTMCRVLDSLFSIQPGNSLMYSLGRSSFAGFSKETARLIFEDLVMAGVAPHMLPSVLSTCEYPRKLEDGFIAEGEALRKFRANAASYRIFMKHGWNKVESGWTPFF